MKNVTILILILLVFPLCINGQMQLGMDIDGESANDESGISVSMPDAKTIAIGAWENSDGGSGAGHVRVYEWTGLEWIQKGEDIDGESAGDGSGGSVSMPDANTVAIGATGNDGGGDVAGHARVYEWDGSGWIQKGEDIDGTAQFERSATSISMPDANTLAIGSGGYGNVLFQAGRVRVFEWNGSSWVQKGNDIDGEGAEDFSGSAVDMPDNNTVAIGAPYNKVDGIGVGHVRIFEWDGNEWKQKGEDIDGVEDRDNFGWSVSMADANNIAIGARENDGNVKDAGHVRIFRWQDNSWIQVGDDLEGAEENDNFGLAVSMPTPNIVGVGAWQNDGDGLSNSGQVKVFALISGEWVLRGNPMNGEGERDNFGQAISMPDANTIGIGGPENSDSAEDAGHVRVFEFDVVNVTEILENPIQVFPNPTHNDVNFDFGVTAGRVEVILRDITGKTVHKSLYKNETEVSIEILAPNGLYIAEVIIDNVAKEVFRIVKY